MARDWPSISDISSKVKTGELKAVDLVKQSLDMIERTKEFEAIISVPRERALERAKEIDAKPSGKLAGVPFVAKDNFLTYGGKTTAAANMLRDFEAPYQATAIEKLEAEGAICIAKANLDAWAHGASTENSDFFVTKNPYDKTRVPGGSSGGSAAATALSVAPFAIGTDTGGSVRQPSSLSGVVGYKPTYGLISRSGVVAMASSTDTIGVMANNSDDVAEVVEALAGVDPLDSTTIERQKNYPSDKTTLKGQTLGVIKEYMGDDVDPGVKKVIQESIDKFKKAGAVIKDISLPSLPLSLAVYYIVVPAEVSSNLARYDGQRYGLSSKDAHNLEESYLLSRELGFGAEAKRRIMIGSHVLSSGYYDAYYKKAQIVRTKLINEFNKEFKTVDFMLGPVSPTTAFKIGENTADPLKMYLADVMTVAANLTGVPAISVPAGLSAGLPVGLQLIAPQQKDAELLAIGSAFEEINK